MKRSTQLWYLDGLSHTKHTKPIYRLKVHTDWNLIRKQDADTVDVRLSHNFIQGPVSLSKNLNISQASALENGIRMGFNIVQHIAHLLENLPSTSTFSFFVATSLPPDLKDLPHQSTRVEIQDREKRHMTHPTRLELRHIICGKIDTHYL